MEKTLIINPYLGGLSKYDVARYLNDLGFDRGWTYTDVTYSNGEYRFHIFPLNFEEALYLPLTVTYTDLTIRIQIVTGDEFFRSSHQRNY